MAYRAALERLCRVYPYRGFESRPLRLGGDENTPGAKHQYAGLTRRKAGREANPALLRYIVCPLALLVGAWEFLCYFVFDKAFELSCPYGMLHLSYCFCLNLPDPLASNLEDSTDLFERVCIAVPDTVPQLDNFAFTV